MGEYADRFEGVTGSAIRSIFRLLADPEIISFAGGNPSPATFPSEQLATIAKELIEKEGSSVLQYGATHGRPEFLSCIARRNADIMKENDDVISLTGSSQGIDLCARTFLNPGDAVVVEGPTFLGAIQTFRLSQGRILTIEMEDDGVNIEKLEQAVKEHHPKFFYTIPNFQNPSGITTSEKKRQQIYEICTAHGTHILEDDPYGALRYGGTPLPSIKSLDDGTHVTRLCSFSKTISPGMRVGYAIGPKDVLHHFDLIKQGADVHTSNLMQDMVCKYLQSGEYEGHVKKTCDLYRKHKDAMLAALDGGAPDGMTYTRPQGGLFLWATLPEGITASEIFDAAVARKVAFVPGEPFYADGGHERTLRLNFSMPGEEQIAAGIARLLEVIEGAMRGKKA